MTNKVKLIKSFAGYPVGEYQLNLGEYCCIKDGSYKIHKDIVQGMPSYFEKVEEEGRRMGLGRAYRSLNNYGAIMVQVERNTWIDNGQYEYGNYYETDDGAKAVSDLRKHVYKFPMCRKDESNYAYYFDSECWAGLDSEDSVNAYYPDFIHHSSTEEDRAERLRLINECIKHNGYLTI